MRIAEPHFDNCFVEKGRAFAPCLDQRDLSIDRRRYYESGKAGATPDIKEAPFPIEPAQPQNLRANHERDGDNTVENVKDDLIGVARMRRQINLRPPDSERSRKPLDPIQKFRILRDHPNSR